MKPKFPRIKWSGYAQLLVPLLSILLIVVFNLIRDPGFFSVGMSTNDLGNPVLTGNLISILNGASELAIIAMGMTLVTAACGGQDISVGALATIAVGFLCCCVVAMLCFFILLQSLMLSLRGKGGLKQMMPMWIRSGITEAQA